VNYEVLSSLKKSQKKRVASDETTLLKIVLSTDYWK